MELHTRLATFPAYSWRADPTVPKFSDDRPFAIFDGVCVLCSSSMRFVAARDKGQLRFIAGQSTLGRALYRHFGLDADDFETVLLIKNGTVQAKLASFVGLARMMGGMWHAAVLLDLLPTAIADRLYDALAHRRYRLFGKYDTCIVPDATWRDRVIE